MKQKNMIKNSTQEFFEDVMNKIKNGYKIIQKDTNVGKYNTMFFTKPGSEIQLRQGDCHAIIRGSFKPIIKKGLYRMGTKVKKASHPWHDENLVYTRWGMNNMRILIIIGAILGFALGCSVCQILILL